GWAFFASVGARQMTDVVGRVEVADVLQRCRNALDQVRLPDTRHGCLIGFSVFVRLQRRRHAVVTVAPAIASPALSMAAAGAASPRSTRVNIRWFLAGTRLQPCAAPFSAWAAGAFGAILTRRGP